MDKCECEETKGKIRRAEFLKAFLKGKGMTETEWKKELSAKYKKVYKKKKVIT
tara:strand:- start:62 stop:220 length:159 start_codon:yes stop_codon:yes gene_type:complete